MLGFMTYYFPGNGPASWKQLLADPEKQWKVGKSARTLANCWEASDGFPPDVSAVLDASGYGQLSNLAFVAGFPEHKVKLPGGSRSSQTDVYVLGSNRYGLASIAVEGKVLEPFGDTVADWLGDAPSKGMQIRLRFLAENLSLDPDAIGDLRYQLLHRTVSAILEGRRLHARTYTMLVHSWAPNREGFDDYVAFAERLRGTPSINGITDTHVPNLYVGWVTGDPRWLNS